MVTNSKKSTSGSENRIRSASVTVRLRPEVKADLEARARERGVRHSRYLEELLMRDLYPSGEFVAPQAKERRAAPNRKPSKEARKAMKFIGLLGNIGGLFNQHIRNANVARRAGELKVIHYMEAQDVAEDVRELMIDIKRALYPD